MLGCSGRCRLMQIDVYALILSSFRKRKSKLRVAQLESAEPVFELQLIALHPN